MNTTTLESTATLRATGGFRFIAAAFLSVWLVGWAVGEVVAIAVLGAIIASLIPHLGDLLIPTEQARRLMSGAFPFIFCFLAVWTTFWTIGGIAAMNKLLRSVAGEDRLQLQPAGMELVRGAGPFRSTRVLDGSAIRCIRIRHSSSFADGSDPGPRSMRSSSLDSISNAAVTATVMIHTSSSCAQATDIEQSVRP